MVTRVRRYCAKVYLGRAMNINPVLILAAGLLAACSAGEYNATKDYLALAPAEPGLQQDPRIRPFARLYDRLDQGPLPELVAATYADSLYFNDTVVTLRDRKTLLAYLEQTQSRLGDIEFEALGTSAHNGDLYVRWRMRTRFTVLGQDRDVQTIGISHLRFNDQGKIILHQDFWDSMQGFYQHIPLIGGLLQWIKKGLHV